MRTFTTLFLLFICITSCDSNGIDTSRIEKIGKELTTTENFFLEDVVNVGDGLKAQLRKLQSEKSPYKFKARSGDIKVPWVDGKADAVLRISKGEQFIDIRLQYELDLDKYHILGWVAQNTDEY